MNPVRNSQEKNKKISNGMKSFLIGVITFYQKRISIFTNPSCKFYPSCSEYAKEAINKYGALKGLYMAGIRFLRCHPWQTNQIDLVP